MNIEEINSYEDIDTYYEAEIPRFIQEILEDRVEALKHCVNYKKEIENLHSIIKEVREIFKDYGEKEDIVGYTMYNITGEMLLKLLEILDKENKNEIKN